MDNYTYTDPDGDLIQCVSYDDGITILVENAHEGSCVKLNKAQVNNIIKWILKARKKIDNE